MKECVWGVLIYTSTYVMPTTQKGVFNNKLRLLCQHIPELTIALEQYTSPITVGNNRKVLWRHTNKLKYDRQKEHKVVNNWFLRRFYKDLEEL